MKKKIIILTVIFNLLACSSNQNKKKVDDDLILRQRAFVEELYLPTITPWANVSDYGNCTRESDWLYLNFHEVRKKTSLDYVQSLNLQYQLNVLWHQKKPYMTGNIGTLYSQRLLPTDRLSLLEQALERVNGGLNFWSIPKGSYPIWIIDWDAIASDKRLDFLSSVLSHPQVKDVIPVIISRCASSFTIKSVLDLKPELLSFSFIIGVELLTIFTDKTQDVPHPFIHPLEQYFDEASDKIWIYPISQQFKSKKDHIEVNGKIYKAIFL